MPTNFIGELKELLDKDKSSFANSSSQARITYEFNENVTQPYFQATVIVPAGRLGLHETLRSTGDTCLSKKDAQQSAAKNALGKLHGNQESDVETTSGASTHEACRSEDDEVDIVESPSAGDVSPSVHRVLLTGGPCGAKSTGISMLQKMIPHYANIIVHTIDDFCDMSEVSMDSDRRRCIQEERESTAFKEAMRISRTRNKSVVLLIDRGVIERDLENAPPHAPQEVLEKYDMIVHMMSPAVDKPEFYQRIEKRTKPEPDNALEEDQQVRRCYQKHANFKILWNGPDKGAAIPVWLGWKMKELLLCVLQKVCSSDFEKPAHSHLNIVDKWLRSKQLREAFGCESDNGVPEVQPPLKKLLLKHLDDNESLVIKFFDHVRFVCPLDSIGFAESLPEALRKYVHSHMSGILSDEVSCACCADKEKSSGKPAKVAHELLHAYAQAFKEQPPKVKNYVDIGSGTCTTASAVSKKLGLSKNQVTCLDVAESCGQRAEDVDFKIFDGQSLPLPSASVDLISIVHVLHHVEPGGSSMFHLLQEVKRVLRPGGAVIIKEHDSPNRNYDLYLEAMHSLKQLVFYTNDPESMPLGSYQSLEEWRVTFRRVGLPVVYTKRTDDIYNSVVMILENIADGQ